MSFTDLGKATGLSTSAVHQRVKRLEQRGIIQGYAATIDHTALDLPLTALISIRPIDPSQPDDSPERLREVREIESCYSVAGDSSYILSSASPPRRPSRTCWPSSGPAPTSPPPPRSSSARRTSAARRPSEPMRRALLSDLFSTLVPGGEAERDAIHEEMAAVLGVDPGAFAREFDATSRERFTGAYGDLPNTLRVITRRAGGNPTDEQVQQATKVRQGLSRRLVDAVPAGTLATLAELRSAGWRIGLVSNITAHTELQWPASPLPPYFDATAFSTQVGAAKPDPTIYLAACTALDVPPAVVCVRR